MKKETIRRILSAVQKGETEYLEISRNGRQYIRKFRPSPRLIVLGGGHISFQLCHMASLLDFEVTVVDDRPDFANYTRFPDAAKVICEDFRRAIRSLQIRSEDYLCILTRGHRWDGECLREILSGPRPSYLGLIGSRRRVKGLFELLEEEGFEREALREIHSPIGLPIHAVTPPEIAVSICGELIEHRRGHAREESGTVLEQTAADVEVLQFLLEEESPKAMILVLETKGSTPVPTGALMAVDPFGGSRGTIGGGCGEAAASGLARRIAGQGGSRIESIDMTNEAASEEGMACGGSMVVLLEGITE